MIEQLAIVKGDRLVELCSEIVNHCDDGWTIMMGGWNIVLGKWIIMKGHMAVVMREWIIVMRLRTIVTARQIIVIVNLLCDCEQLWWADNCYME